MAVENDGSNVKTMGCLKEGWHRTLLVQFTENDLVEIIIALKSYHEELKARGSRDQDLDWPEVRASLRSILEKCYKARGMDDYDQVKEKP